MQASDIPSKFVIPFAYNPDPGTFRVVPVAPPGEEGAASLEKGFTEINMTPVAAGGVPPFGQDFNGLFNQDTAWARWLASGGPIAYDATFQTAIGGYPQGAYVMSAVTVGVWWLSTADDNLTNPDTGGAGWRQYTPSDAYVLATGVNDLAVSPFPAMAAPTVGKMLLVGIAATNTAEPTLNPSGLGALPILGSDLGALGAGALLAGSIVPMICAGSAWIAFGYNNLAGPMGVYTTASAQASKNIWYRCNSSGGPFALTLPASPADGDCLRVSDVGPFPGFAANPVTLERNGHTILGIDADMVAVVTGQDFLVQFSTAMNTWRLI